MYDPILVIHTHKQTHIQKETWKNIYQSGKNTLSMSGKILSEF